MVCTNCNPPYLVPGKLIRVNKFGPDMACSICGDRITMDQTYFSEKQKRWDTYFHSICKSVASKSSCLSRKIGALLVRDNSIVSTGYNGPPRGTPHCGHDRFMKDKALSMLAEFTVFPDGNHLLRFEKECPRKVLGYKSGTHMELCPAQHAEENAVSNAARNGVSVFGTTLYMNSVIPCQKCYGTLINAGIVEIVIEDITPYDKHTEFLINNSSIKIRKFRL